MTTYFTSDLHFYHKNICKFTRRYEVVQQEHHEEWLIDIWNSTVKKSDKIWHLGDLTFLTKYEDIANYMSHREVQTVDHHRIIEKE